MVDAHCVITRNGFIEIITWDYLFPFNKEMVGSKVYAIIHDDKKVITIILLMKLQN